jgi:hypothetical protein
MVSFLGNSISAFSGQVVRCAHSQRTAKSGSAGVFPSAIGERWRVKTPDPDDRGGTGAGSYGVATFGEAFQRVSTSACQRVSRRTGVVVWGGGRYPPAWRSDRPRSTRQAVPPYKGGRTNRVWRFIRIPLPGVERRAVSLCKGGRTNRVWGFIRTPLLGVERRAISLRGGRTKRLGGWQTWRVVE